MWVDVCGHFQACRTEREHKLKEEKAKLRAGLADMQAQNGLLHTELETVRSHSAAQPLSRSATQPLSHSATQPLSRSAAQPLSHSATQHGLTLSHGGLHIDLCQASHLVMVGFTMNRGRLHSRRGSLHIKSWQASLEPSLASY